MKKSLLARSAHTRLGKKPKEPTIALINIVFLLLIFFLAASTIAPPLDQDVKLIDTRLLDSDPPPNALVIRADASLLFQGKVITIEDFLTQQKSLQATNNSLAIRLVPDKQLKAKALVRITNLLKQGGAQSVKLVTQKLGTQKAVPHD